MILITRHLQLYDFCITSTTHMNDKQDNPSVTFNVMEEQTQVHKEVVQDAKVRIVKKVHEEEAAVDVSARSEKVKVERIPVDKYVDTAPTIRYEGDTTIIPVVQEVVVVQKRLLLVEEVHITKQISTAQEEKLIPLRREEIVVERITTE